MKEKTKEIILGTLLGDGSLKIYDGYKNARLSFRHSIKQKEYFLWKIYELKEISSPKCYWEQEDGKIRYQSLADESLTEIYYLTHRNGKININRKWLGLLTPLSLAVWWLDDGSLVGDSRQGVFCTDSFEEKGVTELANYMQSAWKIKTRMAKVMNDYPRLFIDSSEELKKLLRIIIPYVQAESMLYKTILLYKDLDLQKRWISEVASLSNFSRSTVVQCWKEKLSKRKDFRKRYSPSLMENIR